MKGRPVYTVSMRRVAIAIVVLLGLGHAVVAQDARPPAAASKPLPAEIPLFPLPEVVLFPGVSRPLLIYEPRYRDMVADALKGDKIIGTVRLRPGFEKDYEGRPPIYAIGCAGIIDDYQALPDGRYAILLRGLTTFRIVSEDQRKSYRLARIEPIPEILKDEDLGPLSTVREQISRRLFTVLPLGSEPPDPGLDDAVYVNVVARDLQMSEERRQELLERNSVLARARALSDLLAR